MARLIAVDSGFLVAVDRRSSLASAWLERIVREQCDVVVPSVIVAEAWRDGSRQAVLARWLRGCSVEAIDERDGKRAGELLAAAGSPHTIDALVVAVAERVGAMVLNGDLDDVGPLAERAGVRCAAL